MSARLAPLRMLAALLAALALLAPGMAAAQAEGCVASGSERGFGGTGLDAGDRGFGGTGLDAGTDRGFGGTGHGDGERGFGGTGLQAGVYGTVTGFGSVCVNGLRIGYDAETPVERAGRPVEPGELARGQSVVVDAAWRDGAWHADRISVEPSISGPVTAVEAANGRLEVMGERVTTAGAQGLGLDGLRPGDLVSIHGLRGVAGIAATRIEWAPAGERDSVVGRAASASDGGISIGATAIRGIEPAVGRAVRASGV
ncbi:MAG TPA: DUF5666 domain-containing protein, partial [Myxococcota bacterium]|nr:DUF5666 domain-containing protein [Myxococcota bacterium]